MGHAITGDPVPFAGLFGGEDAPLVFAGLADDSKSSYRRGAAAGPAAVRRAYDGRGHNTFSEAGVDVGGAVRDLGDWAPHEVAVARVSAELRAGRTPFFCGGDHAVTIPVLEAYAAFAEPIHVVQLDAHPDLYDAYEGDPRSHACVMARALEMGHVATVTQLGLRTWSAEQRAVAARHPGRCLESLEALAARGDVAVYLTIDLDGVDPAFAPGVAHAVPGGWTSRQALDLVSAVPGRLVGMDVVELLPERDEGDRTAVLAGRLLHEGMGRALAERGRG